MNCPSLLQESNSLSGQLRVLVSDFINMLFGAHVESERLWEQLLSLLPELYGDSLGTLSSSSNFDQHSISISHHGCAFFCVSVCTYVCVCVCQCVSVCRQCHTMRYTIASVAQCRANLPLDLLCDRFAFHLCFCSIFFSFCSLSFLFSLCFLFLSPVRFLFLCDVLLYLQSLAGLSLYVLVTLGSLVGLSIPPLAEWHQWPLLQVLPYTRVLICLFFSPPLPLRQYPALIVTIFSEAV